MILAARTLLLTGLLLLAGCDALEQIAGVDPVKSVMRDNPVDPVSMRPLVFGLESDVTVVGSVRPSIRFSFAEDVVSYSLQISDRADFSTPIAYEETGITEAVHRIAKPLANHGSYHWRVRPRYSDGKEGGWSVVKTLGVELPVPLGLGPFDGSLVRTPFPNLSWEAPTTTGSYEVQIADDVASFNNEYTISVSRPRVKPLTAFVDGSSHFWRVRVIEDGITGDWSAPSAFQIELPMLSVNSPINNESVHSLHFYWSPGVFEPAVVDAIGFQIELNSDPSFPPESSLFALQSMSRDDTTNLPLVRGTSYFWRVRVQYPRETWGPWSAPGKLKRDWVSRVIDLPQTSSAQRLFIGNDGALRFVGDYTLGSISTSGSLTSSSSGAESSDGELTGLDGSIYQIDNYGSQAGIRATASDGSFQWIFSTPFNSIGGLAAAPDGTLYTSYWLRDTSPSMFRFQAISPSGEAKWSYDAQFGTTNRDSVAVTSDGTVCWATSGKVYALTPAGSLRWTYPVEHAALSAGKDGVLFVVDPESYLSSRPGLSVVDAQGALLWTYQGGVRTTPIVDGLGNLYLTIGDGFLGASTKLACLSSSGELKWSVALQGIKKMILGAGGVLFTLDEAYPAAPTIHALAAADGTLLWTNECSPGSGLFSDINLGSDGNLYAVVGNHLDVISTSSLGVDPASPWPMTGGDTRGSRSATP